MTAVTCHACKAYFEVDFKPGTRFTCGACGATLTAGESATPPAAPPPVAARPAVPPPVTTRPAPASSVTAPPKRKPKPAADIPRSGRKALRDKEPSRGSNTHKTIIIAGAAALVLILGAVIYIITRPGDESTNESGPGGRGRDRADQAQTIDPYAVTYTKAKRGDFEEIRQLADLAWQRWEKAKQEKKSQDERKYESHWRWAYKAILRREPESAVAHQRIGDILFDLTEAKSLAELESIPEETRDDLWMLIEDVEESFKKGLGKSGGRIWLGPKDSQTKEWARLRAEVDGLRKAASDRESDDFYPTAQRFGERIAADLQNSKVDFRLDGITQKAFAVHVHKPYVFLVQRSESGFEDRIAQKWNAVLQQLLVTFYGRYETDTGLDVMTKPTPVVILRNGTQYVKYQRRDYSGDVSPTPVTSAGHFEPGNNRLVCYESTEDEERTTLFHEGTHQIVSWAMRRNPGAGAVQALWFSEGIADYFGGHAPGTQDGKVVYIPGRINLERVDSLVDAKKRGDLFTLEDLLKYRRLDYIRDNAKPDKRRVVLNAYAQGWALCYFIQNWKKALYGDKWTQYLKLEFKGRSGEAAFTQIFGAANLSKMEAEYLEMIDALGQAKKAGKIVNGEIVP